MPVSAEARFSEDEGDKKKLTQLQAVRGDDLLGRAIDINDGKLEVDVNKIKFNNIPDKIVRLIRKAILDVLGTDHNKLFQEKYEANLVSKGLGTLDLSDPNDVPEAQIEAVLESAYETYGKFFGTQKVIFELLQQPEFAEHRALINASLDKPIRSATDIKADLAASLSLILFRPDSESVLRGAMGASSDPEVTEAYRLFDVANKYALEAENPRDFLSSKDKPITNVNDIKNPENVDELKLATRHLQVLYSQPIPVKHEDQVAHEKRIKELEYSCLDAMKTFYERIKSSKKIVPDVWQEFTVAFQSDDLLESVTIAPGNNGQLNQYIDSFMQNVKWLDEKCTIGNKQKSYGDALNSALQTEASTRRRKANTAKKNHEATEANYHVEQSLSPEDFAKACFEEVINKTEGLKNLGDETRDDLVELARTESVAIMGIDDPKSHHETADKNLWSILHDREKKKIFKERISAIFDAGDNEQAPFDKVSLSTFLNREKIGKALESGSMRLGGGIMAYRALKEIGAENTEEGFYLRHKLVADIRVAEKKTEADAEEEFDRRVAGNFAKRLYEKIDALDKTSPVLTSSSAVLERGMKNELEKDAIRSGNQGFFGTMTKAYQERWIDKPGAMNATINVGTMAYAATRHTYNRVAWPLVDYTVVKTKNAAKIGTFKTVGGVTRAARFGVGSGIYTTKFVLAHPIKTVTSPLRAARHPINTFRNVKDATSRRWGASKREPREIKTTDANRKWSEARKAKHFEGIEKGLKEVSKYHQEKSKVKVDSVPDWFNRHVA